MRRVLPFLLCAWLLVPSLAGAEEPTGDEERLVALRHSGAYQKGMKHVLRENNDDLRWVQSYYKSCVAQANDAAHEPACARASKAWSEGLLNGLRKQIEAHGLPAGKKPK
jgi:hypothetical protein